MVGLALLTLVPGQLGGSETYVHGLVEALAQERRHDYLVLAPPLAPQAGGSLPTAVAASYPRGRTIPGRLLAMAAAGARQRPLREALADADLVHYPLTIRLPGGVHPCVTTLHDLQHLDLPNLFSRAERAFRAATWHPSVKRSDLVIVPSAFVRERAVARLGLSPERVRVVPLGVDHNVFVPSHDGREPFLLYPARPWPHKNHERLFEAFRLMRRERPDLRLVLTGGGSFPELPDGVELLGHVHRDELVSLLQRAAALVFPSLYEGFGLPVLEAMACGCPVACSDAASLPELAGGAACLFDPNDAASIADGIRGVLDDPDRWRSAGLERGAAFSWSATATATETVYGELL